MKAHIPWLRIVRAAAEIAVALAVALLFGLAPTPDVDPQNRIGQVAGLANIQRRYAVCAIVLLAAAILAAALLRATTRPGPTRTAVLGLACAATAGLAGGAAAAGIGLALRGTPWGLLANQGDAGNLIRWAKDFLAGRPLPATYPELPAWAIGWLSDLTGRPPEYAWKTFEIVATAATPPLAYAAWRMILTPPWALVVGVTSALALMDAYKPYPNLTLIVLVPVFIVALASLRTAGRHGWLRALAAGIAVGLALAVLFESYFGWFLWSAPGFLVALALLVPWRRPAALARAVAALATAVGVFVLITYHVLFAVLTKGSGEKDNFFYFDTTVRPTFFARWFDDRPPTNLGVWPLPGGLGNVDLFTVLLFAGLGLALVLGHRRTDVLLAATLVGGAWLLRFHFASEMYTTQTVQLYPRTNVEILYCLLAATGLTLMLTTRRSSHWSIGPRPWLAFRPGAVAGLLAGALLLYGSMADAFGDNYMPTNKVDNGRLAHTAHTTLKLNGTCPDNTRPNGTGGCAYVPPTHTPNGTPIPLINRK